MSENSESDRVCVVSSLNKESYISYKGNSLLVPAKGKVRGLLKSHIGKLPKGLKISKKG